MSPGWVVGAVVGTALVVVLTALVVRLLTVVSTIETSLVGQRQEVRRLRDGVGPRVARPSSLLLLLEPQLLDHRALAADIRAAGQSALTLPVRIRVADSDAGRELVAGFPVPVEFERRTLPMTADAPAVLVLDEAGQVLTGGAAASVADVRALVAAV
jgi:hypothetical protein